MSNQHPRVLVVGDAMVDKTSFVTSSRRAQESDIPIWDSVSTTYKFGGAGNVAENVGALGGKNFTVYLYGIFSDDILKLVPQSPYENVRIFDRPTLNNNMEKYRIVEYHTGNILARIDTHKNFSEYSVTTCEKLFLADFESCDKFDAVIVSDYDKGTVTQSLIDSVRHIPLKIVDSKRKDLTIFSGFDILKVNDEEYSKQSLGYNDGPVESLFKYVVRTMGDKGADLRQYDTKKSGKQRSSYSPSRESFSYTVYSELFPVEKITPVDVIGCGDTHTAAMVVNLLSGGDIRSAVSFGNRCARIAVSSKGTTVVDLKELEGE